MWEGWKKYFFLFLVFCLENCSDLYFEKNFEITRALYSSSGRSEQFLKTILRTVNVCRNWKPDEYYVERLLLWLEKDSNLFKANYSGFLFECYCMNCWTANYMSRSLDGKGQLISKANFEVFIWTKKWTKIFLYSYPQKWVKL